MGKIIRFYQAEDGVVKKTQKTPTKEIKGAETYKGDYLRRNKRHE